MSELCSNDRQTQLASDFGTIADVVWSGLKQQGVSVNLDTLTWLAHYGNFSSFEALSPETFLVVNLHQINGQFQETEPETVLLNTQDFVPYISKLPLEPVFEVLH
ncbi:hypothetical protein [Leptolyngbya sp. NIES-2104]|uniref:hypothetical protein n=1 Tax=Leptolyngbya sp. NIES-2104 TaxID=1552121 RepID=UPI00178CD5A5|nr:hypothetical protein [Leptolyngbya sp. NIES-2104]